MIWCFAGMLQRVVSADTYGILIIPDELIHDHDETTDDEFVRMFAEAMMKPLDETP